MRKRLILTAIVTATLFFALFPATPAFASSTEYLYPNGAGIETSITTQYPSSDYHWDKVDEVYSSPDDDTTYVFNASTTYQCDLYALANSTGTGTINYIKLHYRFKRYALGTASLTPVLYKTPTSYEGSEDTETAGNFKDGSYQWTNSPFTSNPWSWSELDSLQAGIKLKTSGGYARCTQVYIEVNYTAGIAPTVTTQAASSVEATTATGNGNITNLNGGGNATVRGFDWDIDTGAPYANSVTENGSFGTGAYTLSLTSLPTGVTIYYRAKAYITDWGYGSETTFLTKPAAPTGVSATDGTYTDKVTITWTKSTGATDYHVWRDTTDLGAAGDVATYDDSGAGAPYITAGATVASDGDFTAYVQLSLSGQSANPGITSSYYVVASNATGNSANSSTNDGYIGVGSLTYQWQRSAADSDASYSNITGGTTLPYDDTAAPADGSGRYFKCVMDATGAAQATSTANRGYRATVLGDISSMTGTVTSTSIAIIWTKASGGNSTLIRYRINTFPSSETDGTLGYSGSSYHCILSGLTPGQAYFIAAWGYNGTDYSDTPYHVVLSTYAVNIPSGAASEAPSSPTLPTLPSSANQAPSYSEFNLEPFTSIISYFVEGEGGLGMPLANVWGTMAIFGIVIGGLLAYIKMRNFFIAYFVVLIATVICVGLHLTQAYLVGIEIVIGAGIWAIERYAQ